MFLDEFTALLGPYTSNFNGNEDKNVCVDIVINIIVIII